VFFAPLIVNEINQFEENLVFMHETVRNSYITNVLCKTIAYRAKECIGPDRHELLNHSLINGYMNVRNNCDIKMQGNPYTR